MVYYGQSHLARNNVSISNTISPPRGSMRPTTARGSREIDAAFVQARRIRVPRCVGRKMQTPRDRCVRKVLQKYQRARGGEEGGVDYDVVSIKVRPGVQGAGSCRAKVVESI